MIYKKKYSWRYGHGVSAEEAGKVMEKIEERDGVVTKESFLEESRPESSPTHNCFEWDDSVAAEAYRLEQARHCINDLQVTLISDDDKVDSTAFVNVIAPKKENAEYKSIDVALEDEDHRKAVVENALAELSALKRKYNHLIELQGIFTAITNAEAEVYL